MDRTKKTYQSLMWGLFALIVVVLGLIVYPVLLSARSVSWRSNALSTMKDLGTSCLLYSADFDERMPPFVTFSHSAESTPRFVKAIKPYLRGEGSLLCSEHQSFRKNGRNPLEGARDGEGSFGIGTENAMDFVHSWNLRSWTSPYTGKLNLKLDSLDQLEAITYLRDPIRSCQLNTSFLNSLTHYTPPPTAGLCSIYGGSFTVNYLDTHAKSVQGKPILDIL